MSTPASDDSSGQHLAAGNALLGLGVTGALIGFVLALLHVELRFIDARSMMLIGVGMAAVGVWQRAAAKVLPR